MKYRRLVLVLVFLVVTTLSCGSCGLPGILGRGDGKPDDDGGESPAEATAMLDEDEQPAPTPASEGLTATTQPTPQYPFSIVVDGYELTAFAIIEVPDSSGMREMRILFAQREVQVDHMGYSLASEAEVILTTQEGYEYEGEFNWYLRQHGVGVPFGLAYWISHGGGGYAYNYARLRVAEGTSGYVLHFTTRQGDEIPLPLDGVPVLRYEADSRPDIVSDRREIVQRAGAEYLFEARPPESTLLDVGEVVDLIPDLEITLLAAEREGDSATIMLLFRNLSGGYEADAPILILYLQQDDGFAEWYGSVQDLPTLGPNEEATHEFEFSIYPDASQVVVWFELMDRDFQWLGEYVIIVD